MGVFSTNWEDEENNRIVEFAVEYRLDSDQPELIAVTPRTVTFVEPNSKVEVRKINIWTDTARRILTNAFEQNVGSQALRQQLNDSLLAAT